MNLKETVWEGVDWIDVAQGKNTFRTIVIAVMNIRVP